MVNLAIALSGLAALISSTNARLEAGSAAATAGSSSFKFTPINVVQARAHSDKPKWNAQLKTYVSKYYTDPTQAYQGIFDSVNTASVEGVLKYVQSECINQADNQGCQRKNGVQYISFYNVTIVQPMMAVAAYGTNQDYALEYGPYIAMDSGACTKQGNAFPAACEQLYGTSGQPDIGNYIGGAPKADDMRAPYNNTYWYSFPNGDDFDVWNNKTTASRAKYPGGLCPIGTKPDGVKCTFSYTFLGYINLDDLVGISAITNPATNTPYNYTTYCNSNHTEFSATDTGSTFINVKSDLTFWNNPTSYAANDNRTAYMIQFYNNAVQAQASGSSAGSVGAGTMYPLPSPTGLTAQNPPCYVNSPLCASAPFGCTRSLYSQICMPCSSAAAGCVKAPATFTFPKLPTVTFPTNTTSGSSSSATTTSSGKSTGKSTGKSGTSTTSSGKASSAKTASSATGVTASVLVFVLGSTLMFLSA